MHHTESGPVCFDGIHSVLSDDSQLESTSRQKSDYFNLPEAHRPERLISASTTRSLGTAEPLQPAFTKNNVFSIKAHNGGLPFDRMIHNVTVD
jgi:hypothetical protein